VDNRTFLTARALVLADLESTRRADPQTVSMLEDAVSARQWWAEQWPEGAIYVAGLVAQDVQDALFDGGERWPTCQTCDEDAVLHSLHIEPDLGGPDPTWVCEESGQAVAPLGSLDGGSLSGGPRAGPTE
jgi:hypothetical protein